MNYSNNCHIERINSLITLFDGTDPGWLRTDCNWKSAKPIQVSPKHKGKPRLANREHFLLPTGVSFCIWRSDVYLAITQCTQQCSHSKGLHMAMPADPRFWELAHHLWKADLLEAVFPEMMSPWVWIIGCLCLAVQYVILNNGH